MSRSWRRTVFFTVLCLALLSLFFCEGLGVRRRRAETRYFEAALAAAEEFSVPLPLVLAVIRTESDFRPGAVSEAGAIGLMQLMPETFAFVGEELLNAGIGADITDPAVNIRYGTAYLAYLLRRFPEPATALAAYNAGEGRVSEWLADPAYASGGKLTEIPFPETKRYVAKVTEHYHFYCQKYHTEWRIS